jgi:BolA protein
MSVQNRIKEKLQAALPIDQLEVVDQSHLHAGHAGSRPEGETHFQVKIVSSAFRDKSRIESQRMVFDILRDELAGPVHALSLSTKAPG